MSTGRGARVLGLAVVIGTLGCSRRTGGGGSETPVPAAVAPAGDTARDNLLVTEAEYQGWRYFQVYCARCHGEDALGSMAAPDLTFSVSAEGTVTRDTFMAVVRDGAPSKEMQGFRDLLDDWQIDAVLAYVTARSQGRLARGRPHRAPTD